MKKIFCILMCLGHMLTAQPVNPVIPKNDPAFDLVFSDEFDSTALRRQNWLKRYPWGHFFNSNKIPVSTYSVVPGVPGSGWCPALAPPFDDVAGLEMDYTSTNNISFSGDTCSLIARKENKNMPVFTYPYDCNSAACGYGSAPCLPSGSNCFVVDNIPFKYTNCVLVSKFKFKYGYFEVRFKEPYRVVPSSYNAFTAAFWLLDISTTPTDLMQYSEIDWMENNGVTDWYNSTVHWRTKYMSDRLAAHIIDQPDQQTMTNNQWHTVGGYWYPGGIDFYKDDVYSRSWKNDTAALLNPMYIIMGAGTPEDNFCVAIDTVNTPFPYNLELDYIKVWQQNSSGCDTSKTVCNKTLTTHPPDKTYKSITESGTSCTVNLNNGSKQILGKDYVYLQEGFEVGNNATVLMETRNCYVSDFFRFVSSAEQRVPFNNFILTKQMKRDLYFKR